MTTFAAIAPLLEAQAIEVPSWAYGNSGTRFKVFGSPGTPRTVQEKIADAAAVHRFTGLAPSVALHIPWDLVDDFGALRRYAEDLGIRLGTINSNTFQDDDYKLGSLTHTDPKVRQKAVDHNLACIDVMNQTGSRDLKIWLADGTNYPGQGDIRARQEWLAEGLRTIYDQLGPDQRLVLEYKFFEPAFYHTDVPDWGTSYVHVAALGERAKVCLDTGHHALGTNIEFIVAQLLRLGKLGSFDCNSRFYADDDLMVGAADPFQFYRILVEVVRDGGYGPDGDVALMLDQCHNIEKKVPGQIRSVLNVHEMMARALLLDIDALDAARTAGDVLLANEIFMDAFYTDVRPALAGWREERGLPAEPLRAYLASGYQEQIEADRVTGADVELVWVKGSGGDLGTLTGQGLAVLRLDRLRALVDVYPGVDREDEMVAAFDYCLHGRGGAAPSIGTAMHGLVDAAHVDHLHPDAGIALATAGDGEALTKECYGEKVVWVPWRRPGFQLGLDIAAIKAAHPEAVGCILGGHGITAWGATSEECEANSLEIINGCEAFIAERGAADPFGARIAEPLDAEARAERAAALAPVIRG